MKIDFTGRGVEITPRIRDYSESKLERLKKHLEDIHDIGVVLSVEKYRHKAEIRFQSQKRSFHGHEETNDMFHSIDGVISKLENQVRKYKQKINTSKKHTSATIRHNGVELPQFETEQRTTDREVRIIRREHGLKPMNLDEAVEELEKLNQEFIIFRNAESDITNVIYRRKDGHIGLVDPGP